MIIDRLIESDITLWFASSAIYSLAWIFYYVFFPGKYEVTLGKWVMKLKIYDLDEKSLIGYKRSFFRVSIPAIVEVMSTTLMYFNPDGADSVAIAAVVIMIVYVVADIIIALSNEKRRALHDLMAGSVVIDTVVQQREKLLSTFDS